MREKGMSLKQKAQIIRSKLIDLNTFTVSDVQSILAGKKSTLYWSLWNLVDKGYIRRVGKGLYSFHEKDVTIQPIPSELAKRAWDILSQSGFQFFISGLDILSIFMDHKPEKYPVIVFTYKYSLNEVFDMLSRNDINVVLGSQYKLLHNKQFSTTGGILSLYPTTEFDYSKSGYASVEKAFVDTYFEVTRNSYPLSIQELTKIYVNMKRRMSLDTKRLIKIATRRNIHYDIRYIVESKHVTKDALNFGRIINEI